MTRWNEENQHKFDFIKDMLKTILSSGTFSMRYEPILNDESEIIGFENNAPRFTTPQTNGR